MCELHIKFSDGVPGGAVEPLCHARVPEKKKKKNPKENNRALRLSGLGSNTFKPVHTSVIYYNIYVVLFVWLFPYKSPDILSSFSSGDLFNDMMSKHCCLATSQSLHCCSWFRVLIHSPF